VKNFFEIFYPFLLYSVSSVVKIDINKMYRKGSTMNEISAKEKLFEKVNSEIERQSNLSKKKYLIIYKIKNIANIIENLSFLMWICILT